MGRERVTNGSSAGSVLCVTQFPPGIVGHGGIHRTFQLQHDASEVVGKDRVVLVSTHAWRAARARNHHDQRAGLTWARLKLRGLGRRWARVSENPFKLLSWEAYSSKVRYATHGWLEPEFIEEYADLARKTPRPAVCIIEHAMFRPLIELNRTLGIPTIAAFQNMEALDAADFEWRDRRKVLTSMTDLGNELRVLGQCAERLPISKVEAGFIGGLGLGCHFYPYLPVGELRETLVALRARRLQSEIEAGLFVLLGTAEHTSTRDSIAWFLERATEDGLPAGARVVVVGLGTDRLLPAGRTHPAVDVRGWVSQPDLDTLLKRAAAAVIPQRLGFGAVTRAPELACAGIPVVTLSHSTHAFNPTPGLIAVEPAWSALVAAMQAVLSCRAQVGTTAYEQWEAEQPRPLGPIVSRLLTS
jgi:hypothetical protein